MNDLVTVRINGRNIRRFIQNLYKRNVQFYHLQYEKSSVIVDVSYEDYKKIKELGTIYDISIIRYQGILRLQNMFHRYRILLGCIFLGICFLVFLSHLVFEIDIIHDKKEIRDFLLEELQNRGVQKFSFVKSFDKGEKIATDILQKNRDKLEWLEIERVGTKYIVRVEERKQANVLEEGVPRDLIAKKKGIIVSIQATHGEVVKKVNDYVEEGDVIVTGVIKNKDTIKDYVAAEGQVFAETWYQTKVEIPYFHKEVQKTGRKQKVLSFDFLSFHKRFLNSYDTSQDTILFSLKNSLLPFSLSLVEEEETSVEDSLYTYDQALLKARETARGKLQESLGDKDEIIYEKNLKNYEEDSKIVVEMFFKVREDITSYIGITKEETEEEP